MNRAVSFERSFRNIEKQLKKDPDDLFLLGGLVKLQEKYDKYVCEKIT